MITINNTSKRIRRVGLALSLALAVVMSAAPVQAQTTDASTAILYYRIGGANAAPIPPTYARSVILDGEIRLKPELACGLFDLEENLAYLFDSLKDGLDRAVDLVVFAATNALAELPFYLLRRADPNLANLFENGLARYEELIRLAAKSCQQLHEEILDGENPYANWRKWGSIEYWKDWIRRAKAGEEAHVTDVDEAAQEGETGCIIWINGEERACEGRPPINPIEEICQNGYELLTTGATEGGGFDGEDSRLKELFGSEQEACEWMVNALGDFEIDLSEEAVPASDSPIGVYADLNTRASEIYESLSTLMDDANVYNGDYVHSDVFDVPGFEISNAAIQSLRELPTALRDRALRRVATEYSLLITMEIINQARRILIVGAADPHVSTTEPAYLLINEYAVPRLLEEYDMLNDEFKLRQSISQTTLATVIDAVQKTQSTVPNYSGAEEDDDVIINGAILDE